MSTTIAIGTRRGIARWQRAAEQHASWLGLPASLRRHSIDAGTDVAICRFSRNPNPAAVIDASSRLDFDEVRGQVIAEVPIASPEPLYIHRSAEGLILADDLRLLVRMADLTIDPAGVFALFRHGFIPAPHTPFRDVQRVGGGHTVRIDARTRSVATAASSLADRTSLHDHVIGDPAAWLTHALDSALRDVPSRTALYFSGGVDSSLLAARLVRLGRTDVRFVHFSFGPDDPDTQHARLVAAALGIHLREVLQSEDDVETVATRIGLDYSYPFGDASVIASNVLAHATTSGGERPDAVVEGTGADGSFAVPCAIRRWQLLYSVPMAVRRAVASAYERHQLWGSHAPAARWCQTVRRSTCLPMAQAALATNALDGVAYRIPPGIDAALQAAIRDGVDAVLTAGAPDAQLGLTDVMFACAGRMASKTYDPLRARGVQPVYPFLSTPIVLGAARMPAACKCQSGEAKALLKSALAHEIPASLVYRPKRGFTPPYRQMFASGPMQRVLHDRVLQRGNALLDFCNVAVIRDLVARASRGGLNVSGCDFLWTLAFASTWLEDVRSACADARRQVSTPFEPCADSLAS